MNEIHDEEQQGDGIIRIECLWRIKRVFEDVWMDWYGIVEVQEFRFHSKEKMGRDKEGRSNVGEAGCG